MDEQNGKGAPSVGGSPDAGMVSEYKLSHHLAKAFSVHLAFVFPGSFYGTIVLIK
jgi:hypothetical protein